MAAPAGRAALAMPKPHMSTNEPKKAAAKAAVLAWGGEKAAWQGGLGSGSKGPKGGRVVVAKAAIAG
jgi:hypothetical protein